MKLSDYTATQPEFELFEYFLGETRAYGQFQDSDGSLKRRFTVDIQGAVENDQLTLIENFTYDDGETELHTWVIDRGQDGVYQGKSDDVVGIAQGRSSGAVFNWQYILRMPYQGSSIDLRFDDWMFLHQDQVLINRARVSKFGFTVGQVTITFIKSKS